MWVWLTAESWQDCSIIFSDDLQLQNQLITLVADEELGMMSNSISRGWVWAAQDHKKKVVCGGGRVATMQEAEALACWPDLSPEEVCWGLALWLPWEATSASASLMLLQLFHIDTSNMDRGDLGIAQICIKGSVDSVQQCICNVWLLPVRRQCIRSTQQTSWVNNTLHSWCLRRASGSTTMGLS